METDNTAIPDVNSNTGTDPAMSPDAPTPADTPQTDAAAPPGAAVYFRVENVSHLPYGGKTRETIMYFPPGNARSLPGKVVDVPESAVRTHAEMFRNSVQAGLLRFLCRSVEETAKLSEILETSEGLIPPADSIKYDDNSMLHTIPRDPSQPNPLSEYRMPVTTTTEDQAVGALQNLLEGGEGTPDVTAPSEPTVDLTGTPSEIVAEEIDAEGDIPDPYNAVAPSAVDTATETPDAKRGKKGKK